MIKKIGRTAKRLSKNNPQLKYIIMNLKNISLGYIYTIVPTNNGERFTILEIDYSWFIIIQHAIYLLFL